MIKVENILSKAPLTIDQKVAAGKMIGGLMKMRREGASINNVRISIPKDTPDKYVHATGDASLIKDVQEIAGYMHGCHEQGLVVQARGNDSQYEIYDAFRGKPSEPIILFDLSKNRQKSSVPQVPVLGSDLLHILE
ncbi:MAG: hypothetical protein ACM3IJ_01020 [Candidatus Levyibacteriota bacterium]